MRPKAEGHAPCDSAEPPHVLILEVRAITPAEDEQGDDVGLAVVAEMSGDVELARQLRVLRIAHLDAVDPDCEQRTHRWHQRSAGRDITAAKSAMRARCVHLP